MPGQPDGLGSSGQGREQPAGFEFGELTGVADEHELAPGLCAEGEQLGQGAGADHPGLVHKQDTIVWQVPLRVLEQSG